MISTTVLIFEGLVMHTTAMENTLAVQPVKKLIWAYAIPGIVSQLVNSLHNIVDQVFLGWTVGEFGIAATNIVFPISAIITGFSVLFGMGTSARFSILLGKKQKSDAADVMGNGIALLLWVGVAIMLCTSVLLKPMLYLFGATELILPYAQSYARIICLGVPFGLFATGMSYLIRADGNPNYSSIVLLSGAVFNMVFDPIFLYIFHMGIEGVALATVLGQVLSSILALYYLLKKMRSISISKSNLSLHLPIAGSILSLGAALFSTHILALIAQVIQLNMLKHYGGLSVYGSEIALAAAGAVGKLSIVFLSSIIGIAIGTQPIIGFNLGNKTYGRVKETYLLALRYGSTVAIIAYLLLQLFPSRLLMIFGSDDPRFIEFGIRYIRLCLAVLFLNAVQPTTATFCTAMGKAKLGFWMSVIRQGILLIPALLIFPLFWGIDGVLIAGAVSDGVAGFVALIIGLKQVRWLNKMKEEQKDRA